MRTDKLLRVHNCIWQDRAALLDVDDAAGLLGLLHLGHLDDELPVFQLGLHVLRVDVVWQLRSGNTIVR